MSNTPYEINPKMIEHHECYSDAIFSIDIESDQEANEAPPITVRGGRFDEFARRHTDLEVPAVGTVITLENSKIPARFPRHKSVTPSVYVVQLGFGPKVRSLLLIDQLRQSGVPVFHDLASNSLSTQLRDAEARDVKYVVIVGQKEFVEDTVILRDMSVRTQEYVPQSTLVRKLKRRVGVATF
jgi:histidyl-tRNA synthetase